MQCDLSKAENSDHVVLRSCTICPSSKCNFATEVVQCWWQRVRHLALVIHIAPSHGKGNSAQPESLMLSKIPEDGSETFVKVRSSRCRSP